MSSAPSDPRLDRWRADTAAALAGRIHLNNAGAALVPSPVSEVIARHLALESRLGGYEAADAERERIDGAYEQVAALIGAEARNVAVVENATVGFAQALSAFDLASGDVILTTRNDYASNHLMYLSLAERRGVEVVLAEDAPEGGVDPESVRTLTAARAPAVVALTWVPTSSGIVQPAEAVGEICADAGIPYLVDACQVVGQMPADVAALRCDFLAASARKFLRGPRGIGFLYVSDSALEAGRRPLYLDMRGADWVAEDGYALRDGARRFENWEFPYALLLGMGEAARYAREVGVEVARDRARSLAVELRDGLAEIDGVRVLDRGPELCAIVTVAVDGWAAGNLVAALRDQGVNTSAVDRTAAVLDLDEKGVEAVLRLSPHYYNTSAEVRAAVHAVQGLAEER